MDVETKIPRLSILKIIIMKFVIINRKSETEADKIEIKIGEKIFKISQDEHDDLVVNKTVCDNSDETIIIKPSVSNQIKIK